jgi:MoaA/NifB/PqqE/SkfB family radical SAM enzyme
MCDSWKKPNRDEMGIPDIENMLHQLPEMDAVRLTGGEPFLRLDLLDITHLIQKTLKPRFLHITTNGFLTDRIVRFCEMRSADIPLHLLFSVDGFQEKHNAIRGVDTAWSTATATLHRLSQRKRELNLEIAVNQTILDRDGIRHFTLLRDYLRAYGIPVFAVMAYAASATYSVNDDVVISREEFGDFTTYGRFSKVEVGELCARIETDLKTQPFFIRLAKRYYWMGIRKRFSGEKDAPNPSCVALGSHLRLLPDGRVPTCQFNSQTVGDLRRQDFEEIWKGQAARRQRDWVRSCPGCWAECEVIPNAVYTGDLLRKAPGLTLSSLRS